MIALQTWLSIGRRCVLDLAAPGLITLSLVALGSGALAPACATRGGPAGDPSRMSESEYDVANDYWQRQRDPRQALEHALKAVELDEENADAAHLTALLYLDFCSRDASECRLSEAERYARLAVAHKPDFREAKNTLGVVLIHGQRYQEAVAVLKPLTEDILYRTPEIAWGNLGWAYLELGQPSPAVNALKRSVAAQPRFCVGHYRLGLGLEQLGELDAAVKAFSRALEDPDPRCQALQTGYLARARVYRRIGKLDEAASDLERCLGLQKQNATGKECQYMREKLK